MMTGGGTATLGRERMESLTGLRCILATVVVVRHLGGWFGNFGFEGTLAELTIYSLGQLGVSGFFVLSGFVLYYNYPPPICSIKSFYFHRLARVYPAYLICTLMAIPLDRLSSNSGSESWAVPLLLNLIMMAGYNPSANSRFNDVGWTLQVETFFYLLFPLLCLWLIGNRPKRAVLVAVACSIGAAVAFLFGGDSFYASPRFPPLRLWEFSLGILAGVLFAHNPMKRPLEWLASGRKPFGLLCLLLLSPLIVGAILSQTGIITALGLFWYGAVSFAVILTLAARDRLRLPSVLALPAIVYGGEISYSLYLVHHMVIRYFRGTVLKLFHSDTMTWTGPLMWVTVIMLGVVCLIAAHLLYRYWEVPGRKWILRVLIRRDSRTQGSSAAPRA